MQKAIRGAGASILTLALLGAAPAMAQDSEIDTDTKVQGSDAAPGEIIVTAQKRSQRLQDVPVSISAFTSEQLEGSGIINLTQIAPRVPGFYGGSAGATRPQLYIRGIGSRQFDAGSEASVGVFVDEVYLGRTAGTLGALRDIERIEVLKGPQGTLYGRNTIGGAINVITKGPTDSFALEAEAGIGNYDAYNVFAAVSGPLLGDTVKGRIAGWRTFSEGYMRNPQTGNHAQGIDNYGGRLRLDFEPSADFRISLIGELLRDDGYSFSGKSEGTIVNPNAVFFARAGAVPVKTPGRYAERTDRDNLLDRNVETFSGKLEWDVGLGTLTSITAYRHNRAIDDRDFDNTSLDVIQQVSDERSKQFTQELRFASDPSGPLSFGGAVDWIVGGFYYNDRSTRIDTFNFGADSVKFALTGARQTDVAATRYQTKSLAAFAQATVHITDALDLTLGGRYTEDDKDAISSGTTTAPGIPLVAANFATAQGGKFSSFDPRVTLSYQPTRDLNFYASYNQGFKSGGFQYVPFSAAQANVVFEPESLDAYEVGFKTQLLDRRLTFNGSAYYYDYKDLQVLRVVAVPGGGAATLITNAATSEIKGFELELVARPSDRFEANLSYAYTDAKYKTFPFNATTDFSDTRLVRAPVHSVNVGAQWTLPFDGGNSLQLRADYALLSQFFFEPGEGNAIYGTTTPLAVQPSYGLLDLRATARIGDFRVSAFVMNATDKYYRRTVLALPGQLVGYPGAPRTYGLTIGWSM